MSPGDKIIRAISGANLVRLVKRDDASFPLGYYHTLTWSSGAAEQLDALVEEIVRERLADVAAARNILTEGEK